MSANLPTPIAHLTFAGSGGVNLHAVAAGPADGPPVLLLHGFPEFWYGWRHQLGPLAAAGFRAVAVDQRGYNTSDKPPAVADYTLDRLADDVAAIADGLGVERLRVVGHDWGGGVAWWAAVRHPGRVDRLAVLNCPHPAVMGRALLGGDLGQMLRSWYMALFQVPRLADWLNRRDDFAGLAAGVRTSARAGAFTDADLAEYRKAWAVPGAFPAMLNWYRAAFQKQWPRMPADPHIRVPVLLIWGANDPFLRERHGRDSLRLCPAGRLVRLPAATHWVQHEEPGRVNAALIEFLSAGRPATSGPRAVAEGRR